MRFTYGGFDGYRRSHNRRLGTYFVAPLSRLLRLRISGFGVISDDGGGSGRCCCRLRQHERTTRSHLRHQTTLGLFRRGFCWHVRVAALALVSIIVVVSIVVVIVVVNLGVAAVAAARRRQRR